jgi:DNA-binding response OmpR family regulator
MSPLQVLIVDDSDGYADLLTAALAGWSHVRVCGRAPSLRLALREFAFRRPDASLIDIQLPDGLGFELVHFLRATLQRPQAVATMTSAWSPTARDLSLAAGAEACFDKACPGRIAAWVAHLHPPRRPVPARAGEVER